jgi:hypothetical protein
LSEDLPKEAVVAARPVRIYNRDEAQPKVNHGSVGLSSNSGSNHILHGRSACHGYGYLSKVSKAPTQIRALLRETAALNDLLAQIQDLVDNERDLEAASVLNTLDRLGVLNDCNELIGLVQKIVKRCGQVVGKDVQKPAKNLLWPFKENETKDLMAQLSRLREILSAAIAVDSAKALKRLEEVGKAIDQKVLATLYVYHLLFLPSEADG